MTEFVVDASVALTWCFPDEHSSEAARILGMVRGSGNRAVVPSFFYQEVVNAVLMAERRKRITATAGHEFIVDILAMPFFLELPTARTIETIEELAKKHRLTAYDASYLELALRLRLPLASFDNALAHAAKVEGVLFP